jgi:hypothetical protein
MQTEVVRGIDAAPDADQEELAELALGLREELSEVE